MARWSTRGPATIDLTLSIVLVGLLLSIVVLVLMARCDARWAHSGHRSTWGLFAGCQVEHTPGIWMPDDQLRPLH